MRASVLSLAPVVGLTVFFLDLQIIFSELPQRHSSFLTINDDAMHLNIKNDEAHKLATELARLTGESLTSAVTAALRERLARERRRRHADDIAARLMRIGNRYAALPDSGRSPDEILGYDEHGLPT